MTIQAQVKVEDLAKMVTWPKMVKTWKRLAMSNTVLCIKSKVLQVIERHQPTCTRLDFDLLSPWPKSAKQVCSLKRRLHECGWVRKHSMGWCIESFEMVKWTHLEDWKSASIVVPGKLVHRSVTLWKVIRIKCGDNNAIEFNKPCRKGQDPCNDELQPMLWVETLDTVGFKLFGNAVKSVSFYLACKTK